MDQNSPLYRQLRPPRSTPVQKHPRLKLWRFVIVALVVIITLLVPVILISKQKDDPITDNTAQKTEPTFDKTQFAIDDPASPWVVVNKKRPLDPKTYVPVGLIAPAIPLKGSKTTEAMQLQPEAALALEKLVEAAKAEGVEFKLASAYRSYQTQEIIYDSEVEGFGQEVADKESARPGHSEHQTGWAADLAGADSKCELQACFADTSEGKWLAGHAYKYGFIIRYAKDKTNITGYVYEPWHLRYIGTLLAEEMHRTGTKTLEEFFNLPFAPTY